MKIECPGCKLSGNIDDSTLPATGLGMTCPRCKTHFTAERPVAGEGVGGAMFDACPACQYATFSEEKFSRCPRCGLVVADYLRKQLSQREADKKRPQSSPGAKPYHGQAPLVQLSAEERKREEESLRKHGLDKMPGSGERPESVAARNDDNAPLPVMIVGWATVLVAIILCIYGISGILEFAAKLKQAKEALLAGDEALSTGELLLKFALFPGLTIIYSLLLLLLGSQFLLLRRWAMKALEAGAWVGVGLSAVMELFDMVSWCRRASDNASFGYYATGILGGLLMAALWIVPLMVLADYLKSEQFEKISKIFT